MRLVKIAFEVVAQQIQWSAAVPWGAEAWQQLAKLPACSIATSICEDPEPPEVLSKSGAPLNLIAKPVRQFTEVDHGATCACRIEGASAGPTPEGPRALLVLSPSWGG